MVKIDTSDLLNQECELEHVSNLVVRAIEKCLELESFPKNVEVNLILTNDENIRQLNLQHRKIDSATDVLSFPATDMERGRLEQVKLSINPETKAILLGDIVISVQRAHEQARLYAQGFEREMVFLATHGLFHLLGYHHETGDDEIFKKQEKVLSIMKLEKGEQ